MKILVLGGCGIQGRAALHYLAGNPSVTRIICADADLGALKDLSRFIPLDRIDPHQIDVTDNARLRALFEQADAAIDLLPRQFMIPICQMAIDTHTSMVNTNYAYSVAALDAPAKQANVTIMAECGLDPGIDLIIYAHAKQRFDQLHAIQSYCGGLPEAAACDNPLNYKVSWTWEGVLSATMRDSVIIRQGKRVDIAAANQHDPASIHAIEFPGLGKLEAIPNGDAAFFTDLLGVTPTIRETGRYSLRWPGWSAFWRPLKQLGFLSTQPVAGLDSAVSPFQMLDKLIGPQIQYADDEKDLVAMVNVFEGAINGQRHRLTIRMLLARDLKTGLMAMSQSVGYPAAIAATMLAAGQISATGVCSPALHMPVEPFLQRLAECGIQFEEAIDKID